MAQENFELMFKLDEELRMPSPIVIPTPPTKSHHQIPNSHPVSIFKRSKKATFFSDNAEPNSRISSNNSNDCVNDSIKGIYTPLKNSHLVTPDNEVNDDDLFNGDEFIFGTQKTPQNPPEENREEEEEIEIEVIAPPNSPRSSHAISSGIAIVKAQKTTAIDKRTIDNSFGSFVPITQLTDFFKISREQVELGSKPYQAHEKNFNTF